MSRAEKNRTKKQIYKKKIFKLKISSVLIMVIITMGCIFYIDYYMNNMIDKKSLVDLIEQRIFLVYKYIKF